MTPRQPLRWRRIAVLCAALVICAWVGWRDFEPWIAQEVVRDGIRFAIRRGMQVTVQWIAPVLLLACLFRECVVRRAARPPHR